MVSRITSTAASINLIYKWLIFISQENCPLNFSYHIFWMAMMWLPNLDSTCCQYFPNNEPRTEVARL